MDAKTVSSLDEVKVIRKERSSGSMLGKLKH